MAGPEPKVVEKPEVAPEVAAMLRARPVKVAEQATAEAQRSADTCFRAFMGNFLDNDECRRTAKREEYQLFNLNQREGVFENCQVQYAYNQRQDIYTIKATLDGRPRVITMRVGGKFSEVSLADLDGNVLEVIRQEEGKGITMSKKG